MSSYEVAVVESVAHTVLQLHRTIRADHAGDDIGTGMTTLHTLAAAAGLTTAGPPSTTYHSDFRPGTTVEVDFTLPVEAGDPSAATSEGLTMRAAEPGWYARTVHRGGYETITRAYRALETWLATAQYRPTGPPTEVYLVSPEQAVGAHDLVTEIRIPVTPTDLTATVATSVSHTVPAIREALVDHGFTVLNELDVRAAAACGGTQIGDYVILSACHSELAAQALDIDPRLGLMTCCTLVVRAEGDYSIVEAADPRTAVGRTTSGAWDPIARQLRRRLATAVARVRATSPAPDPDRVADDRDC
ncbi:DUF302 domain-containing protein [Nocardia bhagyanarayanae]|uniref:Effector-binding domain-containing protein n=1 Tax=Nocardia bhagyanarayanae TaxID=1215925 RepID=A0A543FFK7_9NOCA|nr:GyrI-like domain-containing protein [Nocardia bhagyanarayanae]TQM32526.1 effector-binding domain-containing protein [Nocardia bhagyanarayanae]